MQHKSNLQVVAFTIKKKTRYKGHPGRLFPWMRLGCLGTRLEAKYTPGRQFYAVVLPRSQSEPVAASARPSPRRPLHPHGQTLMPIVSRDPQLLNTKSKHRHDLTLSDPLPLPLFPARHPLRLLAIAPRRSLWFVFPALPVACAFVTL